MKKTLITLTGILGAVTIGGVTTLNSERQEYYNLTERIIPSRDIEETEISGQPPIKLGYRTPEQKRREPTKEDNYRQEGRIEEEKGRIEEDKLNLVLAHNHYVQSERNYNEAGEEKLSERMLEQIEKIDQNERYVWDLGKDHDLFYTGSGFTPNPRQAKDLQQTGERHWEANNLVLAHDYYVGSLLKWGMDYKVFESALKRHHRLPPPEEYLYEQEILLQRIREIHENPLYLEQLTQEKN